MQDSLKKFIVLLELLGSENLLVQSAANLTKNLDKKSGFLKDSLVNVVFKVTASGGDCLLNYIFK